MEWRSLFRSIFGRKQRGQNLTRAKLLNGYSNTFTPWAGNAYDNATVRTCIDTIARQVGKMKARHLIRKDGNIISIPNDGLNYLLSTRPNWLMTAAEFLEKITTQYYINNNLFVYIQRDMKGNISALWPLDYNALELYEDGSGSLYTKFTFGSGEETTVPYEDLIHIRRHFNRDEIFGDPENRVLSEDLSLLRSVKVSIINAVQNFGRLRGIINWAGTVRPDDQEKMWKKFIDSFARPDNGSGIGALDNRGSFQELKTEVETFDSGQMTFARDNIYKYFGISEKIIAGSYNEEEFQAFYESVIEPIAVKLSQEFTEKLFTPRERGYGNEVIFETNRLSYMSVASKVKLVSAMIPAGAIKRNEIRELFGYAGLPGPEGEEIVVSLNYVKAKDQSLYQVGRDDEKGSEDDEEGTSDA